MEARFTLLDAARLLQVDAAGKVDLQQAVRMARDIAAYDGAAGGLPVLLDARTLQGELSLLETVELVKILTADWQRYQRRLALLVRADDQLERARFLETYAQNRGIPIAAFTDWEMAVAWLHALAAR